MDREDIDVDAFRLQITNFAQLANLQCLDSDGTDRTSFNHGFTLRWMINIQFQTTEYMPLSLT